MSLFLVLISLAKIKSVGNDVCLKTPDIIFWESYSKRVSRVNVTEVVGKCELWELSVRAESDSRDVVGRRRSLSDVCSSESKVNTQLHAPSSHFPWELPMQAYRPTVSPLTAVICGQVAFPSARSDPALLVHWPTGLHPCKLGPALLLVPYVMWGFFRPVMDTSRPWEPCEAAPERGIKQISPFFQKRGWMSVITYNLKF